MNSTRLRWGACAWLLTLQFFVVETIAELRYAGSYSRGHDVISVLGAADSPTSQLMNASFVVQAVLILGGALLLQPLLAASAARVAQVLLGAAAAGVLLVGVFPTDGNETMHAAGAVLYLVGGGLGLIALAYAVRPRSEAVGTALAVLGLLGTAGTVFFLTGVTRYLGEGGTERVAAYALPIGLATAGVALWLLRDAPLTSRDERRAERDRERAERAERERERDAAVEAATRRTPDGTPTDADDDPWTAPRQRTD